MPNVSFTVDLAENMYSEELLLKNLRVFTYSRFILLGSFLRAELHIS
jgi:hypothetical protein